MTVVKIAAFHIFMIHIVNSIGFRYVLDKILVLKKDFYCNVFRLFLTLKYFSNSNHEV